MRHARAGDPPAVRIVHGWFTEGFDRAVLKVLRSFSSSAWPL
jgi:hypothetical protein